MELIRTSRPKSRVNPKKLLIFSNPKVGKTSITAQLTLEGKWVLLDFEKNGDDYGADFVDGTIQKIDGLKTFMEFYKAVKEEIEKNEHPYEGIAVDSLSVIQDLAIPMAGKLYKMTAQGKNWREDNSKILELPNGAGYQFLRIAFMDIINKIYELAPHIILLGHKTDKDLEKKGVKINYKELDLLGKLKSIVCAQADAVGYLYRKDNETILSFIASETEITGARCEHLRNKEIVIASSDEDGVLNTHWDRVYLK